MEDIEDLKKCHAESDRQLMGLEGSSTSCCKCNMKDWEISELRLRIDILERSVTDMS